MPSSDERPTYEELHQYCLSMAEQSELRRRELQQFMRNVRQFSALLQLIYYLFGCCCGVEAAHWWWELL